MTSTPMQRVNGSDRLWATYIGVGGLSIPPGTNVSLGLRLRSSTEQRSAWCWSAGTMIGRADGLVKRGEGRGKGEGRGFTLYYPCIFGGCFAALVISSDVRLGSILISPSTSPGDCQLQRK